MDEENYARAQEEQEELEREESERLGRLEDFQEEGNQIVNELNEVISERNELDQEREELKQAHTTLRSEYNERKKPEMAESAIAKLERERNKLEWECEELEDKPELDPLERIDLAFKQKKIENLNEMENMLNQSKHIQEELENNLEELEKLESKLNQPNKRRRLTFDYARYWQAHQNLDFEELENLFTLQYEMIKVARTGLNIERKKLKNMQEELENNQDILEDFEIEDTIEYHQYRHNELEEDEIDHVRDALDHRYFDKPKQPGIENELEKFKRERKEFELELGEFENELKKSNPGPEFEQHERMKLEYMYKLEETESYIEDFKHKRERLDSELDKLTNEKKKKDEEILLKYEHKEITYEEYRHKRTEIQRSDLKSRREKIEELRELGRVFEECKLELEELENNLQDIDEAISKKLKSTPQSPPVSPNPEPTPLPKSMPPVAKENNKSGSNTSLPDLTPSKEATNVLTGSIHSTLEKSKEGNLTPTTKNNIGGLPKDDGASKELTGREEKIAAASDMIKNLVEQDLPYKQETDPRSLRTDETPEALAKMDCSELVSRYLKELGLFDKVQDFTTRDFASDKFKNQYEGKLKFMNESKTKENGGDPEKFIPQSGDIFVWRDGENGHTGIVKEYLVDKEQGVAVYRRF